MKPNKLKFLTFIIPVLFLLLGVFYKDNFYYIVAIVSLLLSLLLLVSQKSVTLNFKLPRIDFRMFIKSISSKFKKNKKIPANKVTLPKKTSFHLKFKEELINRTVIGILVGSALLFTVITLFLLPESKNSTSIFVQFYLSFAVFAAKYLYIIFGVILAILSLVGVLIWKKYHSYRYKSLIKLLSIKTGIIFAALVIGFHLGFGISYLIATIQAGYVAIGSNMGIIPGKIIADTKEINKKIQSAKSMPHVVYYEYSYKKSLVLVRLNPSASFYGSNLITNVPDFVFEQLNASRATILLVDDKLLITELKEDVLGKLSPAFGKLLVKNTFKDKNIKSEPKINLLNRQEYLKLREKQINEEVKKLDDEIAEVDQEINVTYGYINENKKQLQEAEDFLANSEVKKTATYNECKTAGENYEGHFYRYYTDDQCNTVLTEWDALVREIAAKASEIRSALNHNQQVLADYQSTRTYIAQARNFVDAYKEITPNELGIFLPEKDIKIALDSNNPDVFNGYLATLVHEYLHYTTYVSEERELDHFFEEGLTEYFARKIMKKQLNYSENVGYPVAVKIIEEIMKKVPEDKLLAIYFTKDQKQLEYLLNNAYGKNFYEDSSRFFSLINYLPEDESLKAANTIMVRMGGKKISKESLQ